MKTKGSIVEKKPANRPRTVNSRELSQAPKQAGEDVSLTIPMTKNSNEAKDKELEHTHNGCRTISNDHCQSFWDE